MDDIEELKAFKAKYEPLLKEIEEHWESLKETHERLKAARDASDEVSEV